MLTVYERVLRVLSKAPEDRTKIELLNIEDWFRKKSKLLKKIARETLLDVIQHCEFVTRDRDDVIIQQGEKGHRFYIILRGSVAVFLYKDATDDLDLGEESLDPRQVDRSLLGFQVATISEGQTFGEIALINADCIRTASIICEDKTDLVCIHRDLYNRSVSKVIAREYAEKVKFIDSIEMFNDWAPRLKHQMAVSLRKDILNFDSVLVKQGDPINDIFFIVKGEVKLVLDPEAHFHQYEKLFGRCSDLMDESTGQFKDANFPQKLLPQLEKITRINKASMIKNPGTASGQLTVPMSWSPSAIRKMNLQMNHKRVSVNLCFLGQKQIIGDVEFLLGLETFHTTAICSRETTLMVLNRNHFDRMIRKRSPRTLKRMAKMIETQLTLRCLKHNILESAPIMRCFLYKLQEQNGERKRGDEKSFLTTLRSLATTFEAPTESSSSGRLPQAPTIRSLVGQPDTPERMSGFYGDTPDEENAHLQKTTADLAEIQRSRTIKVPKVEV